MTPVNPVPESLRLPCRGVACDDLIREDGACHARRRGLRKRSPYKSALLLAFGMLFVLVAHAAAPRLLFIHGAAGAEDGGDPELLALLSGELGCDVHRRSDAAEADPADDARHFDLVYISASVFSGNVGAKYRNHSLPVLVSEALIYSDRWMAMAKLSRSEKKGPHLASIQFIGDAPLSLTTGHSRSTVPVSAGQVAIWSWGADLGPGAKVIAVATVSPTDSTVTASDAVVEMLYEKGAQLTDGSTAQGLRLGITWVDSERPAATASGPLLTPEAKALLRAAIDYAMKAR